MRLFINVILNILSLIETITRTSPKKINLLINY